MDPLSLLALLPSIGQAGFGIYEAIKGNKWSGVSRTNMPIPQAATDALNLSKSQASSPLLPGYGLMKNNLDAGTASSAHNLLESGGSGAGTQAALVELAGKENTSLNEPPGTMTVGRSSACNMILDYRTVSTVHAKLFFQNNEFFIQVSSCSCNSIYELVIYLYNHIFIHKYVGLEVFQRHYGVHPGPPPPALL